MWVCTNWIGDETNKSRLWACVTADRGSGWWDALMFADEVESEGVRINRGFVNLGMKLKLRTFVQYPEAFVYGGNGMTYWIEQPSKEIKDLYADCIQRQRIRDERLCPDCLVGQRELYQEGIRAPSLPPRLLPLELKDSLS